MENWHDPLVDALPYIDQGHNEPGVREAKWTILRSNQNFILKVLLMIEEETKRYKQTKNYLAHLPPLELHQFETDLLKNEIERIEKRQPIEPFSMKRYELPAPTPAKSGDVNEWSDVVDNSYAQLEHQLIRIENLELMNKFGVDAWKAYNNVLQEMLDNAHKEHQTLKKSIQEVNWNRKNAQTAAGVQLTLLEGEWVSLVSKNYDIERACVDLENNLNGLRPEK